MKDLNTVFAGIIGNVPAVDRLKIYIEGARRREITLPHVLMTGSKGGGKTTLSRCIADALGADFIDENCPSLPADITLETLYFQGRIGTVDAGPTSACNLKARQTVVLLDECHLLGNKCQNELLKPMLDKVYVLRDGTRIDVSAVTFILATTNPEKLVGPLKDRCPVQCDLEPYTDDELARIISAFVVEDKGMLYRIRLNPLLAMQIAQRSRGIPRIAKQLAEGYYNYLRNFFPDAASTAAATGDASLAEYFKVESLVGEMGLKPRDLRYLETLATSKKALGVTAIAAQLGFAKDEVESNIEPFMRQRKLIQIGKGGREITDAGRKALKAAIDAAVVNAP